MIFEAKGGGSKWTEWEGRMGKQQVQAETGAGEVRTDTHAEEHKNTHESSSFDGADQTTRETAKE